MTAPRYLFPHRHLLGIQPLTPQDITAILDQARGFEEVCERPEIKIVPALRKRLVVNLFFENSTRTRNSFEIAEKRLSAEIINFDADTSSLSKGETLIDTAMNLQAMHPDLVVMRHSAPGAHALLARHMRASIVNAGDGAHEHPPQALLDAYTLRKRFGRLEGLRVAIIGDIRNSRVVRSNLWLLTKMGAHVTLVGPPTLIPEGMQETWPTVTVSNDLRVRPLLPAQRGPDEALQTGRGRAPSRPHQPRRGDHLRGCGRAQQPGPVPGHQRRAGAHGRVVPHLQPPRGAGSLTLSRKAAP